MVGKTEDLPAIYTLNSKREAIIKEVADRVLKETILDKIEDKRLLDNLIADVVYHESVRFSKRPDYKSRDNLKERIYWKNINKKINEGNYKIKEEILFGLINRYARDVIGSFNPKVYKFVIDVAPVLLTFFFKNFSGRLLKRLTTQVKLDDIIITLGETQKLLELSKKGTIILVPTHSSNMDSIVIGWALAKIGLPPVTYGAGKNLFANLLFSFFMGNLGAYKVDRRIKNKLYKDVLKMYSTVILEHGFHSLFFPGGTRCRSNIIEKKLKLGLLGTGLTAYINNLKSNAEKPNIYIIPCILNYPLVLEAKTLIDDYLKETGKSRYIIIDDEFSKYSKILRFIENLARMDSSVFINFAQPMDPFGNRVEIDGKSYDKYGREIDISKYVLTEWGYDHNFQRDAEYTKELGKNISESYYKHNIILSTSLVSFVLFNMLRKQYPDLDLYRLLKLNINKQIRFKKDTVMKNIAILHKEINDLANQNQLYAGNIVGDKNIDAIYAKAMENYAFDPKNKVAFEDNGDIILNDLELIFYYHNRVVGYDLANCIQLD